MAAKPKAFPGGAKSDGIITPVEPSLIARVTQGVRYALTGTPPDAWFGPSQPLQPEAQEQAQGRQWDYPVGFNTRVTPRAEEQVSYLQLRALADNLDILRVAIETRKDQMCRQEWVVRPRSKDAQGNVAPPDDRCEQIMDFLRFPDREHDFATWLRMVLEEMFVIDAASVYPRLTRGGGIYSLDLIDGATIKRVLNVDGRTPVPPDPAYQQIIKGLPAVDYSRDELLYLPRNPRVNKIYGYSPVEQIVMTVNIALRRQLSQLAYFTDGSSADLIFNVPDTWNPDQIRQFKEWWDSMLAGNIAARRGTMFVPGGVKPYDTKDRQLKDDFDEWLTRIVCYAMSLPPTAFSKQVVRATAGVSQDASLEEGLEPVKLWAASLMNQIIGRWFNAPDLEFAWAIPNDVDALVQAQIDQIYVQAKVMTPDEIREGSLSMPPLTPDQQDLLNPPPPPELGGQPGKPGEPGGKKKPPTQTGMDSDSSSAAGKVEKKNGSHGHLTVTAPRLRNHARRSARY